MRMRDAPLHQRSGERRDRQPHAAERHQRTHPADIRQQPLRQRQQRELTERACRRRNAERHAALLGRERASERPRDHTERDPRQPGADQHTGREHERQFGRRVGHPDEARDIQQATGNHDARRAVLVGQHSRERLRRTPYKVLHGERESKRLASPMHVGRDRLQEQAEAMPYAHREREDQAAAHEHHGGRAPGARRGMLGSCGHRFSASDFAAVGCSASRSCSVAISASSLSLPIRLATFFCARIQ